MLYEDAAKQKNAIKNYYGKMKEDQKRELERAGIKPRQIQDMMGEIASKVSQYQPSLLSSSL